MLNKLNNKTKMANCGNFLDYTGQRCGVDVGIGRAFLLFKEKTLLSSSVLTIDSINSLIADGTIIGAVKDWHTVAGAPVAEINAERPVTGEMKLIRDEILADTLTFEQSVCLNEMLRDIVRQGTFFAVLIDDMGNILSSKNKLGEKYPMVVNFSGKTTSSLQSDNASDKSVAVTVRYLSKDVAITNIGVDISDIVFKTELLTSFKASATGTTNTISFDVTEKCSGVIPEVEMASADIILSSGALDTEITLTSATYTEATGVLALAFTAAGAVLNDVVSLRISGSTFYSKKISFSNPWS